MWNCEVGRYFQNVLVWQVRPWQQKIGVESKGATLHGWERYQNRYWVKVCFPVDCVHNVKNTVCADLYFLQFFLAINVLVKLFFVKIGRGRDSWLKQTRHQASTAEFSGVMFKFWKQRKCFEKSNVCDCAQRRACNALALSSPVETALCKMVVFLFCLKVTPALFCFRSLLANITWRLGERLLSHSNTPSRGRVATVYDGGDAMSKENRLLCVLGKTSFLAGRAVKTVGIVASDLHFYQGPPWAVF